MPSLLNSKFNVKALRKNEYLAFWHLQFDINFIWSLNVSFSKPPVKLQGNKSSFVQNDFPHSGLSK